MRVDNGMSARYSPDLSKEGRMLKDSILLLHKPRDHVLGKTSYVVEQLESVPMIKAISRRGIKTVQLQKVFAPDTVLLGFGLPNVFLAKVFDPSHGGNPVARFDAKSLYRAESQIVSNKNGNDQSGFYIVPNLTLSEVKSIENIAAAQVGTYYRTCSYAISTILHNAGFTTGEGRDIRYTWPSDLLKAVVQRGLSFKSRSVDFLIVSTVQDKLTTYMGRIKKCQRTPLSRYLLSKFNPVSPAEKERRVKKAEALQQLEDKYYIPKPATKDAAQDDPSPAGLLQVASFDVDVSNPSTFGLVLRKLWGSHSIYRRKLTDEEGAIVRGLLPNNLRPFSSVSADPVALIKKHVLFSSAMRRIIASQHQAEYASKGKFRPEDILELTPPNQKFNFVLTPRTFAVTAVTPGLASWVLSKHLMLAESSECPGEIKMAGEISWKPSPIAADPSRTDQVVGGTPQLEFNNSSGTYRPGHEQVQAFARFLRSMHPGIRSITMHSQ